MLHEEEGGIASSMGVVKKEGRAGIRWIYY
jgi:hypothetical protein